MVLDNKENREDKERSRRPHGAAVTRDSDNGDLGVGTRVYILARNIGLPGQKRSQVETEDHRDFSSTIRRLYGAAITTAAGERTMGIEYSVALHSKCAFTERYGVGKASKTFLLVDS